MGGCRSHGERVPVWRGARDLRRADGAAGPGLVFNDHLLAEALSQFLPDHPGNGIGVAAGCETYDEADRLVGKRGLRLCPARSEA